MTGGNVHRMRLGCVAGGLLWLAAACAGGGSTSVKTTSPNPTATPEAGASVEGLVVVHQEMAAGPDDALGVPPADWRDHPDAASFDRALSYADVHLAGESAPRASTAADGSFELTGLEAGSRSLELTRTVNGTLVNVTVPFGVGDDGGADVVAEVAANRVKTTSTYTDDGVPVREIFGPNDNHLVARDGRVALVGDASRAFIDADGDGVFDPDRCGEEPPPCGANAPCPLGVDVPSTCGPDGACPRPGERCVCVPSCPECDDCAKTACLPACAPVTIAAIVVNGPSQLMLGQTAWLSATALLSDGGAVDVTGLVDWSVSDDGVVAVDSWGMLTPRGVGKATVRAALADLVSDPWPVVVSERPPLRRIIVQNLSCWCGPMVGAPPETDMAMPPCLMGNRPPTGEMIWFPTCRDVLRIGKTVQFNAVGEFGDGAYFEDITDRVQWSAAPEAVGDIERGLFTARAVGTAKVTAALEGITSDPAEITVVAEATVVSLSIFPNNFAYPAIEKQGAPDGVPGDDSCADCGFALAILRGDTVGFLATAQYDTGEWEDVTARVTWRTTDATVAAIDAAGLVTAVAAGEAQIDATLGEVASNRVGVRVVNEATLEALFIYPEGNDRVVAKDGQLFFHASGSYDVGFGRDVTNEAVWHVSDERVGGFESPGVFAARAAGPVDVWAELAGRRSNAIALEVYETSDLSYCDPDHVNRATWADGFNRVVLESDCGTYAAPGVVTLRYTVTETQPHGGVFDPCLDLFVYRGATRIRTIVEQGCGEPFQPTGAPSADKSVLKYQMRAFWDLKDEFGQPVPPGVYSVFGRFYLYYDPVVRLDVTVTGPGGEVPCLQNPCGNGCGYVHHCGDNGPPPVCPEVCVPLCECPPGWGVVGDGQCERCPGECCPAGAACGPDVPSCPPACCAPGTDCPGGLPPCEPPKPCCEPGRACMPELPPCEPKCCPPGALCGALNLPPCVAIEGAWEVVG